MYTITTFIAFWYNFPFQDVNIIDAFEYEPNEFWVIRTSVVEAGSYQISMSFSGSLKTGIVGFYYSDYTDEEGVQRWVEFVLFL